MTKFKMAGKGTIFKTRTYDFFRPFNEPKELPKSKCAYIEVHTHMLPAPGVNVFLACYTSNLHSIKR